MPPKTSSRTKKTKIEIQQELENLLSSTEEEKEGFTSKSLEAIRLREAEVRESVQNVTVEGIVQRISKLGLDLNQVLSDLSQQLVRETQNLNQLKEAAELEAKELKRLHQSDLLATSVDQLIEEYRTKNQLLKSEQDSAELEWEKRRQNVEKEQKEFEENLKKQRQREKEDYEYQKLLERKREEDEYTTKLKQQERLNQEKQQILEKNWKEREAILKEKEEELTRLRQETTTFPERLKKELDQQLAALKKGLELEHQQSLVLLQKDSEAEKKIANLQIQSLQDQLLRQTERIKTLEIQLEEAKKQVQEIALKAIEGASGAKTLGHINQIAMEQAKNRSSRTES